MKIKNALLILLLLPFCANLFAQKYDYEMVKGDPSQSLIYTLDNGLKIYMSILKDEPRIQTFIAARTGSKNDPSDATGLAHYLEHMLFKGSSKIASLDWEKEKILLEQISDLYELNRTASDDQRKSIYRQIDSLSGLAAKYVATNEYDKMVSSLGAKRTNAYTWIDQTVYVNDIPSNGLEKWLKLESERFRELVLRLFHTELEAVYEEFNIGQNNVYRKMNKAMMEGLFPDHPYGTQTTIGTGEHLKRPSMVKIHEYFSTYYVPNNMAIVLSGDFDPDNAVDLIKKYFGNYKSKKLPKYKVPELAAITQPVIKEIVSKESETISMGWRLPSVRDKSMRIATLASSILFNGRVGLIDLNLVEKQMVGPRAYAYVSEASDYSSFMMSAIPKQGQKLEEVQELLLEQLDLLKKGEFEDWMLEACINDIEYNKIKGLESNYSRANNLLESFISMKPWKDVIEDVDAMRKITKKELVDFVNQYLKQDAMVVVYKREGNAEDIYSIEKPAITPVAVNRDEESAFKRAWDKLDQPPLEPVFLDYKNLLKEEELDNGVKFTYMNNPANKTFSMSYVIDVGSYNDKVMPVAIQYLDFLGTDKYSASEFKKELFKLGINFSVNVSEYESYVSLYGLERSLEKGIQLFEELLANVVKDESALESMVMAMKKERADDKKEKSYILYDAMMNYGMYGFNSPFMYRLSDEELDDLDADVLIQKIKSITSFKHNVFYYGNNNKEYVASVLNKFHLLPSKLKDAPVIQKFIEKPTEENEVVFVNIPDMAQAQILMLSKGNKGYSMDEDINSRLYNEYFGSGLSSIVFQEIRESRALAYSAYTYNMSPYRKDQSSYLRAFVGTQVDKLPEAIPAMMEIINEMPVSGDLIHGAAKAIIKKMNSERVKNSRIYWNYRALQRKGLDFDMRKNVYEEISKAADDKSYAIKMVEKFHENNIKNRNFTYLVIGDENKVDMNFLKKLGEFKKFTIDEICGDKKVERP